MKKKDYLDIYQPVSKKAIIDEQDQRIEYLEDYCKDLEKELEDIKPLTAENKVLQKKIRELSEKYDKLFEVTLLYRRTLEYYAGSQNYCKNVKIDDRWRYGILEDRGNRAKTALSRKLPEKRGKKTPLQP